MSPQRAPERWWRQTGWCKACSQTWRAWPCRPWRDWPSWPNSWRGPVKYVYACVYNMYITWPYTHQICTSMCIQRVHSLTLYAWMKLDAVLPHAYALMNSVWIYEYIEVVHAHTHIHAYFGTHTQDHTHTQHLQGACDAIQKGKCIHPHSLRD